MVVVVVTKNQNVNQKNKSHFNFSIISTSGQRFSNFKSVINTRRTQKYCKKKNNFQIKSASTIHLLKNNITFLKQNQTKQFQNQCFKIQNMVSFIWCTLSAIFSHVVLILDTQLITFSICKLFSNYHVKINGGQTLKKKSHNCFLDRFKNEITKNLRQIEK